VTTTISPARAKRRANRRAYKARKRERDQTELARRLAQTPLLSRVLLDYSDLRALGIGYSQARLYVLMAEGKFPLRVAVGDPAQLYSKKRWLRADIEAWLAARPYATTTGYATSAG
jgi:predicted DNA-binding transcriptional regulator AlpA